MQAVSVLSHMIAYLPWAFANPAQAGSYLRVLGIKSPSAAASTSPGYSLPTPSTVNEGALFKFFYDIDGVIFLFYDWLQPIYYK